MVVATKPLLDANGRGTGKQSPTNGHIESLIQILRKQGFEDVPFAVVALDDQGRARVHASKPLGHHLDEQLFASKFEEAQARALSLQTSGEWIRTARQRGRSTLVQDLSPFSVTPFPYPAPLSIPKEEREISVARDCKPATKKPAPLSFRIDDGAEVTAYLESRLKRLQQLAGKKIAKAWIKGICPKKQARFPYQNHKRLAETGEPPRIPGWWPQEEGVCRFVEPDHIRREERMKLCLHLLRLRPSPQQLKAWNDDSTEHNKTHVMWGWTAFLKELAGPDLFDDLPKEAPNRVKLRQTLLAQMYAVAAMEEQFHNDEIDAGELYFCEEDEEEESKPMMSKRSRRTSTTSSAGDVSRQSSVSHSCTRAKKARRDTEHALGRTEPSFGFDIDMIERTGFDQDPCSQWQAEHDLLTQQLDVAVAPTIDMTAVQSPWIPTTEIPMGDATPAWAGPIAASIGSRRCAPRIRRKAPVNHLDNLMMDDVSVKQEIQPSMPPPQDQIQPLCHPGPDLWLSYPYLAHYPPADLVTQQRRDYQHYTAAGTAQVPLPVPSSHLYPSQSPQEVHICLSLDCCPQGTIASPRHPPLLPPHEYPPPIGSETLGVGMQQPWQQQQQQRPCPHEPFFQPHNGASNFF